MTTVAVVDVDHEKSIQEKLTVESKIFCRFLYNVVSNKFNYFYNTTYCRSVSLNVQIICNKQNFFNVGDYLHSARYCRRNVVSLLLLEVYPK